MKRILFVTHHTLVGNGGGVFATKAFIHAFSTIYPGMTVLYPIKNDDVYLNNEKWEIDLLPIRYAAPKYLKLLDLIKGKVHRYFHCFEDVLDKKEIDIVVFDNSRVSYGLIDIAHKRGLKVITIHHNSEYEYTRDNYTGIIKYLMLHWVKKYEKEAVLKSDISFTLTESDKETLCKKYSPIKDNIEVLGCFEYEEKKHFKVITKNQNPHFIITGNLSALQTEKSLKTWLDSYYCILKKHFNDSSLTIAGKNPSSMFAKKCKDLGITLIPSPISIDSIIEKSDIYICPISLGGGIKLRVMDGLRKGLPVITHTVSTRGYEIFKKEGYLFEYDDTESFSQIMQTMKTKNFNKQDIIDLYERNLSFQSGVSRLKILLHKNDFL